MAIIMCVTFSTAGTAESGGLTLQMGIACAEDSLKAEMAQAVADHIATATDGQITIVVRVDPRPEAAAEMYQALLTGAIDIACIEPWVLGAQFPSLSQLGQPFIFSDLGTAATFYHGDGGSRVRELVAPAGIRIVGWLDGLPSCLLSNRPLEEQKDLQGLRVILSRNRLDAQAFTALGAGVVQEPAAIGRAEALRAGLVDAVVTNYTEIARGGFPEGAKYAGMNGFNFDFLAVAVSNAAWSRLPQTSVDAFLDGMQNGLDQAGDIGRNANLDAEYELRQTGYTLNNADTAELKTGVGDSLSTLTQGTDAAITKAIEKVNEPVIVY